MAYLVPNNRFQTQFTTLDEPIDKNNPVRFKDAFVDKIVIKNTNYQIKAKTLLQLICR